jgi:hypothetical protein
LSQAPLLKSQLNICNRWFVCVWCWGVLLQCGGSAAGVRAAKPLLQLMGKTVEHLGEHGAGQVGTAAAAAPTAASAAAA